MRKNKITTKGKQVRKYLKIFKRLDEAYDILLKAIGNEYHNEYTSIDHRKGDFSSARYYRNICGFLNNTYLNVTFNNIDESGVVDIAGNTKCIDEIKSILKDISIKVTVS